MKIVLVGCGVIAFSHLKKLKKLLPEAKIFLCDVNESNCKSLAQKIRVEGISTNLDHLFKAENPDSVHILTPPNFHFEIAQKCISNGANVFIEKPITETSLEYKTLLDLANSKNKIVYGDYSTLGMPVVLRAKDELKKGGFGRLIAVSCSFAGSWGNSAIPYADPYHWAYNLKGGVLQNMIDHPLSLVLSFMDEVKSFKMTSLAKNVLPNGIKDMIQVTLYNDDQIGTVFLSLGHGCSHRSAELLFEGGEIKMDLGKQLYNCIKGTDRQNFLKKAFSGISEGNSYVFGTIKNFYDALTGKLQKDPGISNTLKNYYNAIVNNESLIVPQSLIMQLTSILDKIWNEIESQNVSKKSLIEEQIK